MKQLFEDKNQYFYFEKFINPILYDVWFSYFNYNNKFTSYQSLIAGSKYVIKALTENKNETFKNYCFKIIEDVFNFIICSINQFNEYKNIVDNDFLFLFDELKKSNSCFFDTLYNIYYSIIYFVCLQQQIYKNTYYSRFNNLDIIINSDSDSEDSDMDLYYTENDNLIYI